MTQQGFKNYINASYSGSGAANSYIKAIRIIDDLLKYDDIFGLHGQSITCINDSDLLSQIAEYVYAQLTLYNQGLDSIFRNIGPRQTSYPRKGFCKAAMNHLLNYKDYEDALEADVLVGNESRGDVVAKKLVAFYKINKQGTDVMVAARARRGQAYFRKMILANYDNKCCITGLNVPQTLRASHIVAWAESKKHRMNPKNGLCLSATYDAAFDKHLISFDEDYRMIVSREVKEYYTSEVTREYFDHFEGKQIILPNRFLPSQELLAKHRELLVR